MEIPYAEKPREDTGLYNGKVGIWLFLASEVMLFGALFSAYVLLRVGADAGTWSMGLMNKWVGAFNTIILIASSVTVVLAWVSLKLNDFAGFRKWKWATIGFALAFLVVKWSYEWPAKLTHYDVTFTSNAAAERAMGEALGDGYEEEAVKKIWQERFDPHRENWERVELKDKPLDGHIVAYKDASGWNDVGAAFGIYFWSKAFVWRNSTLDDRKIEAIRLEPDGIWDAHHGGKAESLPVRLANANGGVGGHSQTVEIERKDINRLSSFEPAHSTFFATYYTLTGLHALHVLGGIIVMLYHLLPISRRVWELSPERFTNRIEITGLFWHFVDLVWIFLFPILYLL
tara:strand:+ start:489 stop:1520 length:1032 start_codon:yes stop_codon:yes gene_type:complete